LAEAHLLHAMAKLGAVVRNRGVLNTLGQEAIYVFDKTGTITYGTFEVLEGLTDLSSQELSILKGLASRSTHPISTAISKALSLKESDFDAIQEIAGKGMLGTMGNHHYYLGSRTFFSQSGFQLFGDDSTHTHVYFGKDKQIIASLVLGDQIRQEAIDTIKQLAPARTVLLSGDSKATVAKVAEACGFSEWYGEISPLEKREVIEHLKRTGKSVCMIGDGINDAPALTAADIGISVLSAADISIQISDILLTTDRLTVLSQIIYLAKKARCIIRQNLFWAFIYNVVGLLLASFGWLSPIFAAGAMMISSLIVLLNAQRLSGNTATQLTDPSI
jgi:P-type E1-E2 ATPase